MNDLETIVKSVMTLARDNSDAGLNSDFLVYIARLLEAYNPYEYVEYEQILEINLRELHKFYE